MSTTSQIAAWAIKNKVPGWLGVFSADRLPTTVPLKPWALVVNYQGHTEPGDHWVGAFGMSNRAYWFSSYGLPPDHPTDELLGDTTYFKAWLNKIASKGWKSNHIGVQSFSSESDSCGQYSVYACKVRGGPLETPGAWSWISTNKLLNDRRVKQIVHFK